MIARFVIRDKKGGEVSVLGVTTSHFMIDLVGDTEEDLLRQVLILLSNVSSSDPFIGSGLQMAKEAASEGLFPHRQSSSTTTIAWKHNE